MRIHKKFHIRDLKSFRNKALQWASKSTHCCYLNGNSIPYSYESFPEILAAGCQNEFLSDPKKYTKFLDQVTASNDWAFGFVGYNTSELQLDLNNAFPAGSFFTPVTLITFYSQNIISIDSLTEPDIILQEITDQLLKTEAKAISGTFYPGISKEAYISTINKLQLHLKRGNIYQVNYCMKFEADNIFYEPYQLYTQLNEFSPMPFSGFLKTGDICIVSASPERYLKKINSRIVSQPMKGTSPSFDDEAENKRSIANLLKSEKERAENVMIVDLVRNDLSTLCEDGTVKVETLCGLYSFPQVHQMVSTVSGTLKQTRTSAIIDSTFPMGSMTGAPKISAMQLIEEHEPTARGPFSGTMGYFDPLGNFDLNVLIRSLFYNSKTGKAFYAAGSGITHLSEPEKEYEECLLKAQTIKQVFAAQD